MATARCTQCRCWTLRKRKYKADIDDICISYCIVASAIRHILALRDITARGP